MLDRIATEWQALVEAFILPLRRSRYVPLLKERGKAKFKQRLDTYLDHCQDLDPRFCKKLAAAEQNQAYIRRYLTAKGAPPLCFVLSMNVELHGQEMDLEEALQSVIGMQCGTFLSCIQGKLAYYEGEEPHERYICERTSQS